MAIKKPFTMKADTVTLECSQNDTGVFTFVGRRRLTLKDRKAGVEVDEKTPVVTFKVGIPDEYKCSHMNVEVTGEVTDGMIKEFMTLIDNVISDEEIVFFRVSNKELNNDEAIKTALRKAGFVQDNKNDDIMEYEQVLTSWMGVFMCIGMCLSFCFGLSKNMMYMPIGIGLGLAIGGFVDSNNRTIRSNLKKSRGYSITKTSEEE